MRHLELREIKQLAAGHTASWWVWSQNLNTDPTHPKCVLLMHMLPPSE